MSHPKNIRRPMLSILMLCLCALALPTAFAQSPVPTAGGPSISTQAGTLDAAARTDIVKDIVSNLADLYVDEDVGKRIGEHIVAKFKSGAYDKLTNPAQFSEAITHDLRAVNGDLHLSLQIAEPGHDGGPIMIRKEPGEGPSKVEKQAMDAAAAAARRHNFGLGRVEILDGNIGYLEFRGFEESDGYEEAVANALRFLENTDAIIIDQRRNHGGSGQMSHLVFSHFLGDKPVRTINFKSRDSNEPESMTSLEKVPGPRRPDVPLYVLTSQGTASAAEEFSFVLQNQHRAILIGSRTAGAGHMVSSVPVAHGFSLGVSITRVTDPVSGKEWEGTGVLPDVQAKPGQALAVAHAEAVRRVLASTSDTAVRQQLAQLLITLDARSRPQTADAATLASYAGIYQGREIVVNGDTLNFSRVGAMPEELTYLGNKRFALGSTQMYMGKSGGKTVLNMERADGTKVELERD